MRRDLKPGCVGLSANSSMVRNIAALMLGVFRFSLRLNVGSTVTLYGITRDRRLTKASG